MIFFIVENSDVAPYNELKDVVKYRAKTRSIRNPKLIAWNEAFSTYEDLKSAIIAAAKQDPVCLLMAKNAKEKYGLDPFLDQTAENSNAKDFLSTTVVEEIVSRELLYLAHPMIADPFLKEELRLMASKESKNALFIPDSWDVFRDEMSAETLGAVKKAYDLCPKLDRYGECILNKYSSMCELARDYLGRVTSDPSRKLEKSLALRLLDDANPQPVVDLHQLFIAADFNNFLEYYKKCLDPGTRETLSAETQKFQNVKVEKTSKPGRKLTYLKCFFPEVSDLSFNGVFYFLKIAIANFGEDEKKIELSSDRGAALSTELNTIDSMIDLWFKLPHLAQAALLLHSFKTSIPKTSSPNKFTYSQDLWSSILDSKSIDADKIDVQYRALDNDESAIPKLVYDRRRNKSNSLENPGSVSSVFFSTGFNEYDPATCTSRFNLQPLNELGSQNNEVAETIRWWKDIVNYDLDKASNTQYCNFSDTYSVAIATAMFAFYRVYMDARIFPSYSFADCMDATNTMDQYPIYNQALPQGPHRGQNEKEQEKELLGTPVFLYGALNQSMFFDRSHAPMNIFATGCLRISGVFSKNPYREGIPEKDALPATPQSDDEDRFEYLGRIKGRGVIVYAQNALNELIESYFLTHKTKTLAYKSVQNDIDLIRKANKTIKKFIPDFSMSFSGKSSKVVKQYVETLSKREEDEFFETFLWNHSRVNFYQLYVSTVDLYDPEILDYPPNEKYFKRWFSRQKFPPNFGVGNPKYIPDWIANPSDY